jgi:spiro-SPASM protein
MKNLVIINATSITPYASAPLAGQDTALSRALAFAGRLPSVGMTAVFCRAADEAFVPFQTVIRDRWTARDLLQEMSRLRAGFDNVFYYYADCPLLDEKLAGRMFSDHVKYFSDYTFADGYPYGLAVEIIRAPILEPLLALVKDSDELTRETVFEVLKRDINAFDLETEIAPVDLRQLRVSLAADTKRNFQLCRGVMAAGGGDWPSVLDVLQKKPELLRTLPAFVSVQIVEGCPQSCSYCPYPVLRGDILGKKAEMAADRFAALVRQVKDFCDDATVSVSLWGEPSLHGQIDELIGLALETDGIDLVIETSGVGWDPSRLRALAAGLTRPPVWIVSLDAWAEEDYRKLRGDGFRQAVDTARLLVELFGSRAYVQAVRMKENEASLEQFYREWKKTTESLIIQKYDHFSGLLPDRKVTDLSPLTRLPCWHVKRDLAVLLDGTVPLCREDVKTGRPLGSVFRDPLESIWRKGEEVYREHLAESYAAPCRACDEYYTFNF